MVILIFKGFMNLYLTENEVAELLKVSTSLLRRLRYSGEGPDFIRVGKKLIRYDFEKLKGWANDKAKTLYLGASDFSE